ncbi:exodeoxyribonuclease V subunit gamma [Pasteurella atlantica]|uniref:Exodeoxyribonuclease V subunit gamma n=2 Tax=Pasteurellaceae TaxID=712 RepID=A0ACC6HK24_9PAST|nr:exodeoxyribonuclease V subunit gamma [Pasteurella atlantica]MDP8051189.1 exodeoxyribonuclease V subunit gamma [Pasteurella atlantica]MDP8104484.1 exodeoxyribonuclease V subunit gamma [Pasteurella atlantica]MDP8147963.1 exodeoxyribonuclease V subunit gamma [Pasteurella atlantica]
MFTVYYANQLKTHKELLLKLLKVQPNNDPFQAEIILVQSAGMAQWLQMEIARQEGIAANFEFPFPTSFLWQQYRTLLPTLPKENIFAQKLTVWQLIQIIPDLLHYEAFNSLRLYLGEMPEQQKYYQLARAIAELFDQYLVYRPHWLIHWENNQNELVLKEIYQQSGHLTESIKAHIETEVQWQSMLWNALVEKLKKESNTEIFNTSHRAYFQQHFFDKLENLNQLEQQKLPKRVFIFGISSLPPSQLVTLKKLSEFCDIHLFFLNPSQHYWGNSLEQKMIDKITLYNEKTTQESDDYSLTANPLLTTWGKQGRDFFNTLLDFQDNEISAYIEPLQHKQHLLAQIQQSILELSNEFEFNIDENDHSLQIHSCHSPLREVEVLHDQLLYLFEQDPTLCPKDILVMSPNIDLYAPYIRAVFERKDPCAIPYSVSDQRIQEIDPIINSFLNLLSMRETKFSAEQILDLLDITAIQKKHHFVPSQIEQLRNWITQVGIRAGLKLENPQWKNYNSWENGLNRLLLGCALKEENGIWEETIAFNESYGLNAELSGHLNAFICKIMDWVDFIHQSHSIQQWKIKLLQLIDNFYLEDETNAYSLLQLHNAIDEIVKNITEGQFDHKINDEIIINLLNEQLENNKSHLNFLAGRVNFATLLPMRAIPFKVVCLLGMNEKDFPRQYNINSFDLMQYAPQKGDRAKRDDDRYLFLEALLSAQDIFYISYVGQSLTKNQTELPSVLVSQLCDYLPKNGEKSFFEENVIQHSMTAFSPTNFIPNSPYQSYATTWLETLNSHQSTGDFLTKLEHYSEIDTIEIEDLIRFIQHPIKFFFNNHLGIYFSQKEKPLEDSEPFSLSPLEKYQFLDQLLINEQDQFNDFFEKEQYKGKLPVNAFKDVAQHNLINELQALYNEVYPYTRQDTQYLTFNYQRENITLCGNLNYYPEHNQVILYRVGNLRDKDIIQCWLYHLLLQIHYPTISISLYFKNKDQTVGKLTFETVEKENATLLLEQYINDYLISFNELQWGIYQNLETFFKKQPKENDNIDDFIQEQLDLLIQKDRENIYLQRILNQTSGTICHKICKKTFDWFELMWEKRIIQ